MVKQETIEIEDRRITLETGEIAKQANASVLIRQLDTVVLAAVVAAEEAAAAEDFVPLTVEYRERAAAAGRIPSGFVKRETRPQDHEILASRLIDRSIRPLFPDNFVCETQVMATVLSYDPDASPEPLAILAACAALYLSDIPWDGPLAGFSLAQSDGKFALLPTRKERDDCAMELVISCSPKGLVMMEGIAQEVPEGDVIKAVELAREAAIPFFDLLSRWAGELGVKKRELPTVALPEGLEEEVTRSVKEPLIALFERGLGKRDRQQNIHDLKKATVAAVGEKYPDHTDKISRLIEGAIYSICREFMVTRQKRIDGRGFTHVRPISGKAGWLPRNHGSAIFTRGETQAIVSCTLGSSSDEQIVDSPAGEVRQQFYLHYNFPPYSVGEVRSLRGPGRREIGHGNLATRALQYIVPPHSDFPYTIRLVSDITESNGSSSMASVCGGCLALMDAGVPVKAPVAGVAMGMLCHGDATAILSDIMGDEDHLGDMDFKVAGTASGITAVQMDNKIGSLSLEIMGKALEQARESRLHILQEMQKILPEPRKELARFAPRVVSLTIRRERIRDLIGPGGKNIQEIQEKHSVHIEVNQSGVVRVYSPDYNKCQNAVKDIHYYTRDLEVGKVYRGVVSGIRNVAAFVRIFANIEGVLHISEVDNRRVEEITDVVREGEQIIVRVLGVDRQGKIRLSRKAALNVDESEIEN